MNLFHHDEPTESSKGPLSDFKTPLTHGENRRSSFGRPAHAEKQSASEKGAAQETETSMDAPPIAEVDQAEVASDGPVRIGVVESSSARMHNPHQPNLFGQLLGGPVGGTDQFGNPVGAVMVGYDSFGNPIYQNQAQGNRFVNGLVQGAAIEVAANVAMDVLSGILDNLSQN